MDANSHLTVLLLGQTAPPPSRPSAHARTLCSTFASLSFVCSLSGCPRARKSGIKIIHSKENKEDQEPIRYSGHADHRSPVSSSHSAAFEACLTSPAANIDKKNTTYDCCEVSSILKGAADRHRSLIWDIRTLMCEAQLVLFLFWCSFEAFLSFGFLRRACMSVHVNLYIGTLANSRYIQYSVAYGTSQCIWLLKKNSVQSRNTLRNRVQGWAGRKWMDGFEQTS